MTYFGDNLTSSHQSYNNSVIIYKCSMTPNILWKYIYIDKSIFVQYKSFSFSLNVTKRGKKCCFPSQGRNDIGKMWVGRATRNITFKVEPREGMEDGREKRVWQTRPVQTGGDWSRAHNNCTRESSWFPTISFVTKGVNVTMMPTLVNSHAWSTHAETFRRTSPFVTQL